MNTIFLSRTLPSLLLLLSLSTLLVGPFSPHLYLQYHNFKYPVHLVCLDLTRFFLSVSPSPLSAPSMRHLSVILFCPHGRVLRLWNGNAHISGRLEDATSTTIMVRHRCTTSQNLGSCASDTT